MPEIISRKEAAFVECFLREPQTFGAQTRAARKAGYGTLTSSPQSIATIASRLMRQPAVINAIKCGFVNDTSPQCCACGSRFRPKGLQKYCSPECFAEAHRKPPKKCQRCFKDFKGPGRQKYCCDDCRHHAERARAKKVYKPRKTWKRHSSEQWVEKAKAAIKALEDMGIEI